MSARGLGVYSGLGMMLVLQGLGLDLHDPKATMTGGFGFGMVYLEVPGYS